MAITPSATQETIKKQHGLINPDSTDKYISWAFQAGTTPQRGNSVSIIAQWENEDNTGYMVGDFEGTQNPLATQPMQEKNTINRKFGDELQELPQEDRSSHMLQRNSQIAELMNQYGVNNPAAIKQSLLTFPWYASASEEDQNNTYRRIVWLMDARGQVDMSAPVNTVLPPNPNPNRQLGTGTYPTSNWNMRDLPQPQFGFRWMDENGYWIQKPYTFDNLITL